MIYFYILSTILRKIERDIDKLRFLCSLKDTNYECYIRELVPSDLNVHYSYYDEYDCVNDILVMKYQKSIKDGTSWKYWNHLFKQLELKDIYSPMNLKYVVNTITFETFRYFYYTKAIQISDQCIYKTISIGRLDILQFLRSHNKLYGCPEHHLINSLYNGDSRVIKWVYDNTGKIDEDRLIYLMTEHGNIEILEWLYNKGLTIRPCHLHDAIELDEKEVARWMKSKVDT